MLAEEAVNLLDYSVDMISKIKAHGLLAAASLHYEQFELAEKAAETTLSLIDQAQPTSLNIFTGYTGPAEVYLSLWETEATSDTSEARLKNLKANALQACKNLHKFARVFPVGQPRAWLYQGIYEWLSDRPHLAQKAWQKSLTYAERLEMPYEQGLTHYEIGRRLPNDDPNRQEHLSQAEEIFTRLGTAQNLLRVQEVINTG
jgi:hypothetical protein